MKLIQELQKRSVFRVGIAYLITSWLLLQVADVVLSLLALPPLVGKIILLLLAFGFIPALILAWAYELTPGGIKSAKDVDPTHSLTNQTGRMLDRFILASVVLAVTFLMFDRFYLTADPDKKITDDTEQIESTPPLIEETPSVAVLPFVNMSGNVENEYFSDGLTETLLHMLAQLPNLRVAARTSAFAFKGKNTDIKEIATSLRVNHVLEGSVQRAGERVRVTAQLIRADDGFHMWSHNYDRRLDDIFSIQDEIARDVVSALSLSLMPDQPIELMGVSTSNTQAYDYYLRALEKIYLTTFAAMSEAEILLKRALAIDPAFFEAKVALAHTYRLQFEIGSIDVSVGLARMESIVAQLLIERPDDPATRALHILIQVQRNVGEGDYHDIENLLSEMKSVLEVAPHESSLRVRAANILMYLQNTDLAINILKDGLFIDPLNPVLHLMLADVYIRLERLDDARAVLKKAQQIFPNTSGFPELLAAVSQSQGEVADMFNWLRKATEVDPLDHEYPAKLAGLLYQFGFMDSGDYWAERVKALAKDSPAYRKLELNRAMAVGDPQQIMEVAWAIIRDKVPNLRSAYQTAMDQYVMYMQIEDRSQQALDELESEIPGVSDFVQPDDSYDLIFMKLGLMQIWKQLSPPDEFQLRYDALIEGLNEKGIRWQTQDWMQASFALMLDDYETAIPAIAKMLDGWTVTRPWWRNFEIRNQNSSLLSEPQIASRLAKYKSEETRWQEQIRIMLQQPEWAM